MVKLRAITILLFLLFLANGIVVCQGLTDRDAIVATLKGESLDGKFTWRPTDAQLKMIAKKNLASNGNEFTANGILQLVFILTGDEYDDYYDSVFLNTAYALVEIDTIMSRGYFFGRHFKKTLYSSETIDKLFHFSQKDDVLRWRSWTPYYLTFLQVPGIEGALTMLNENIEQVNELHYLISGKRNVFDILDIEVCLARADVKIDREVIDLIKSALAYRQDFDHVKYIKYLSKIRTELAFQEIGSYFTKKLNGLSNKEKAIVRNTALAAFLVYVKNFPNRTTKLQETINMWNLIYYSKFTGIDFSTDAYFDLARKWYQANKHNLEIDIVKY